ncbi:unnamed protein product, partial [Musa acuminata subsp. burmannicoides]
GPHKHLTQNSGGGGLGVLGGVKTADFLAIGLQCSETCRSGYCDCCGGCPPIHDS